MAGFGPGARVFGSAPRRRSGPGEGSFFQPFFPAIRLFGGGFSMLEESLHGEVVQKIESGRRPQPA